mgnify:CR=1 FL=1
MFHIHMNSVSTSFNGIRRAINSSEYILAKEPLRKAVLEFNPQAPCLYGLPKVHKDGTPMRPVVSFVSAPSYKLAKYLDKWFKHLVDFRPPFSIKNSIELSQLLIQTSPPPGSILISFEVVWLYPHVPLQPTRVRLEKYLREANVTPSLISDFKSLLEKCLSPNICLYRDSIYTLPPDIGVPIGSPLGSLVSESFMAVFEEELFQSGHSLLEHVFL